MKYLIFALMGAAAGVAGGMGMGGGTILIPLLTLFGDVPQHTAQAINLIAFIPMAVVALAFHVKNKLVDFKGILYAVLPGIAFGGAFAYISSGIDGGVLKRVFGGFLILLAIVQVVAIWLSKNKQNGN